MSKKKVWIIAASVVALLVIVYVICVLTGNLETAENSSNDSIVSSNTENNTIAFGWDTNNAQSEEGTTARVDEILLSAGEAAQKMTEEQVKSVWDEALNYLKQHVSNFYVNSEVMEHSMYYGEFLYRYIEENATASNISELPDSTRAAYDAGYNTVKAIKYVYCGAENVEDEATQSALSEAKEALDKFQ